MSLQDSYSDISENKRHSFYAFFITSTWLAAVFAASIPPPLTMPFKEAFSKQSTYEHFDVSGTEIAVEWYTK